MGTASTACFLSFNDLVSGRASQQEFSSERKGKKRGGEERKKKEKRGGEERKKKEKRGGEERKKKEKRGGEERKEKRRGEGFSSSLPPPQPAQHECVPCAAEAKQTELLERQDVAGQMADELIARHAAVKAQLAAVDTELPRLRPGLRQERAAVRREWAAVQARANPIRQAQLADLRATKDALRREIADSFF
eukprot:SAG31_NODE_713_length_12651_cov_180.009481_8_plen_192_part_00